MEEKLALIELTEAHGPSGRENMIHPLLEKYFSSYGEVWSDNINNLYTLKKGKGNNSIMLLAHSDEIFLMVTEIMDNGFLKVVSKGIDAKTLVSQEVIIHGKKAIKGVIGIKPPHLMSDEEKTGAVTIEGLLVDTGYSKQSLEKIVEVGDYITLSRNCTELLNNNMACKCADDRAGIVAMLSCAKELQSFNHDLDVYFVCGVQEEVGLRGAKAAAYNIKPKIAIALDTTFDSGKFGDDDRENELGKGPVICIGPNIHPKVRKRIMNVARDCDIPFQLEVEPGSTGTDAWAIQVARDGIPTLLLSIPIKYMHTSVEVVNIDDIKNTGRLMARFIERLKDEELEDLICF
ncbi:MAG: M42 family metallopeptidase [Clostridium sp.]|uniref:M42 family metallopeptidase n=1 Tax=Clostridium sp. TaxID=1506 RepID=UPI002A8612F6|nr:M42 family metallopeptidase [Clostridium sp.]MDY5099093.1 M42 family metallopeptidase [Clostridium sp.]